MQVKSKNTSLAMRKALQRKTQEAAATRATNRSDSGGGGSFSASLKIGEVRYYLPDNYPSARGAKLFNAFWLEEKVPVDVILFDTWIPSKSHRITRISDPSALPDYLKRSKSALHKNYACTNEEPDWEAETVLSPEWVIVEDDGAEWLFIGNTEGASVTVEQLRDGSYRVDFPDQRDLRPDTVPAFETVEEAQLAGQAILKSLTSCGFCEKNMEFYMTPREERAGMASPVMGPFNNAIIPVYFLSWLPLVVDPAKPKIGKVSYTLNGANVPSDYEPIGDQAAIRRGLCYLDSPMVSSNRSSKYRTLENYLVHRTNVSRMCATCLETKTVKSPREVASLSTLTIVDLLDPVTGESMLGKQLPDIDQFQSEEDLVQASEQLVIHEELTALLHDMGPEAVQDMVESEGLQDKVFVDETEVYVLPVRKIVCSNDCAKPTPTRLSQVTSQLTRETDGYHTFRLSVPVDGKMLRSWDFEQADTFGQLSVDSSLESASIMLSTGDPNSALSFPKNFDVVSLTAEEARRVIG